MASLYGAKAWYTRRLNLFIWAAVARSISPDVFTALGVAFAALAGVGLLINLWPLVLLGLAGRLGGANLDGAVARARGVSRPFGFVLNELGDRLGDLLPLAALAYLAYTTGSAATALLWGGAVVAASLPTFVSLAGAGAGAARINGGPFGKTERCLIVFVTSVILSLNIWPVTTVLAVGGWAMIVGSITTACWRVVLLRRRLGA